MPQPNNSTPLKGSPRSLRRGMFSRHGMLSWQQRQIFDFLPRTAAQIARLLGLKTSHVIKQLQRMREKRWVIYADRTWFAIKQYPRG